MGDISVLHFSFCDIERSLKGRQKVTKRSPKGHRTAKVFYCPLEIPTFYINSTKEDDFTIVSYTHKLHTPGAKPNDEGLFDLPIVVGEGSCCL